MLTFIRNNQRSFNANSRVFDVYDEFNMLQTQVVVGYDSRLHKYYLCYYSIESFYEHNDRYPAKDIFFWSELINDFIFAFENLFDKIDLIRDSRTFDMTTLPELKRENLYYWVGACYYDEDLEMPQMVNEEEWYLDELLQNDCLIPMIYEYEDEYKDYDYKEFEEDYNLQEEAIDGVLCDIDYDKIIELVNSIKAMTNK